MFKKTYTDVVEHDHQLTVNTRGVMPVWFQLDDGCETIIVLLGYEDVWALYTQLGKWLVRYLNHLNKKAEDGG